MQKASDKRIFFKKNILGKNEMSKMSNKKANGKIRVYNKVWINVFLL